MKGGKNDMKKLRLLSLIVGNKFIRIILILMNWIYLSFRGFN